MKIGILGAGQIAHKMAETIKKMKNVELYAIGSSSLDKSQNFAKQYQIPNAYGSYEELAKDQNIDLIYIATIHTMHYEHALLCLEYQHHVLIEKPMAVNQRQAKELFEKAKEKNLLICEAMWTRFMPSAQYFMNLKHSNIIGKITSVQANIGYSIEHVPRIYQKDMAGGALLDIGIYLLHFANMIFQQPSYIDGVCQYLTSGVDAIDSISMVFEDGVASLHASVCSSLDNLGMIYGDKGYIKVDNINNPHYLYRYDLDHQLVETIDFSCRITGFEYEIEACIKAIQDNRCECDEMPHQLTLDVLDMMDQLRQKWQIIYQEDI